MIKIKIEGLPKESNIFKWKFPKYFASLIKRTCLQNTYLLKKKNMYIFKKIGFVISDKKTYLGTSVGMLLIE